MRRQAGLTFIELVIVIAIIGIWASISYPYIQNKLFVKNINNAFSLLESKKSIIEEYYLNTGHFPRNDSDIKLTETKPINDFVYEIGLIDQDSRTNAIIYLQLQNNLPHIGFSEAAFGLRAQISNNWIKWQCIGFTVDLAIIKDACDRQ